MLLKRVSKMIFISYSVATSQILVLGERERKSGEVRIDRET